MEKFGMGNGDFCKKDIISTIPAGATVSVND